MKLNGGSEKNELDQVNEDEPGRRDTDKRGKGGVTA